VFEEFVHTSSAQKAKDRYRPYEAGLEDIRIPIVSEIER